MARPCSLNDKQKQEILRRSIEMQESPYAIAKAMNLPESTVRRNVVADSGVIKSAAIQIVTAEQELLKLPISAQVVARDYMANLRAISNNLARAAMIGSANAVRLSKVAETEIIRATEGDGLDLEGIKIANGLTRSANDAAQLGVQLIQSNKDKSTEPPKQARSLNEFYSDVKSSTA